MNHDLKLWNMMNLIREFELYVRNYAETDEAEGYLHTYLGQEAIATGLIPLLRDDDWLTSTYRNHGHALAREIDPYRMAAELLGRATGICRGLGGSMHIADQNRNMIGAMGIVAAGIPIATGAAFAAKYNGQDRIAMCFFGDGAIHQGAYHEGMEFAAKFECPVLFVCENNLYAETTATDYHLLGKGILDYTERYGILSRSIDGNDLEEVRNVGEELISYIRTEGKPALLECLTYRLGGQYEGDSQTYKSEVEIKYWLARNPITKFRDVLIGRGHHSDDLNAMATAAKERVLDAFERAHRDPFPDPTFHIDDVYAPVEHV